MDYLFISALKIQIVFNSYTIIMDSTRHIFPNFNSKTKICQNFPRSLLHHKSVFIPFLVIVLTNYVFHVTFMMILNVFRYLQIIFMVIKLLYKCNKSLIGIQSGTFFPYIFWPIRGTHFKPIDASRQVSVTIRSLLCSSSLKLYFLQIISFLSSLVIIWDSLDF